MSFRAIYLEQDAQRVTKASLRKVEESQFPEISGPTVEVTVSHSTLNYKDALAITGKAPVVRRFPHVPGIDFAGVITSSDVSSWPIGTPVIVNGYGVGENYWGGLAEKVRVLPGFLLDRPARFSAEECMALGTAGYTAALCVLAIQKHGVEKGAKVLVTGATGGVGSVAVALLDSLGYEVVAVSGKPDAEGYLRKLGAKSVSPRSDFASPGKPLQKEQWAAAVDTVGSVVLSNVCAGTQYGGIVTACGLAQGMDFPATVAPFILRAVSLVGIDSVIAPNSMRLQAWQLLATNFPRSTLNEFATTISLENVIEIANKFIEGSVTGRYLVDMAL